MCTTKSILSNVKTSFSSINSTNNRTKLWRRKKKTVCFKQTRKFPVHEFVMMLLSLVMTIKKVKKRYYKIIRSSLLVFQLVSSIRFVLYIQSASGSITCMAVLFLLSAGIYQISHKADLTPVEFLPSLQ